jgi:hypothetical protein
MRGSASSASNAVAGLVTSTTQVHVCHWQNCHECFQSVQDLLTHISVKHLETEPPAALLSGLQAGSAGNAVTNSNQLVSTQEDRSRLNNGLLMDFGNIAPVSHVSTGHDAFKTPDGLLECLWDDCLPPVDGNPDFSAFHHHGHLQAHTASVTNDQQVPVESQGGNPPFQSQQTLAPVAASTALDPAHSGGSLDSATAVLKHLLEQHLGLDMTRGLLDAAAAHASAQSPQYPQPVACFPLTPASQPETQQVTSHEAKHSCGRLPRNVAAEPMCVTPSDTDERCDAYPHACQWIGCSERFGTLAALTDHLSECHVGKGKTEYECLWSGCVQCDCDESASQDTDMRPCEHMHGEDGAQGSRRGSASQQNQGRKFSSRQKIMRHLQVSFMHHFAQGAASIADAPSHILQSHTGMLLDINIADLAS